jgi:hypothetical protein
VSGEDVVVRGLAVEIDEECAVQADGDDDGMDYEAGEEAAEQERQADDEDRQGREEQQQQPGVEALDGFAQAWARVQAAAVAAAGGGGSIGSRDPGTPQTAGSELAFAGPGPDGSAAAAFFASINQQQLQHYHSAPGQLGEGSEDISAAAAVPGDAYYGGSSSYPGGSFQQQQQQQQQDFYVEEGGRSMSGPVYASTDMGDSGSRSASPTKAGELTHAYGDATVAPSRSAVVTATAFKASTLLPLRNILLSCGALC